MRKPKLTKETKRIYQMLDFFLRCTPFGLLPFMDDIHELPTSRDIIKILNESKCSAYEDLGTRVTGGQYIPEAQRNAEQTEPFTAIVEECGGVELIKEVFRDWIARYPRKGEMIRLWSAKGGGGIYNMSDVADGSGYTDASVPYRVRESYLMSIAYDIYVRRYILVSQDVASLSVRRKRNRKYFKKGG